MEKRLLPVTSCSVCGKAGYNIGLANAACGRAYLEDRKRKRCEGVNQSAIGIGDWSECPSCKAAGWEGPALCSQCEGAGWLFVRGQQI